MSKVTRFCRVIHSISVTSRHATIGAARLKRRRKLNWGLRIPLAEGAAPSAPRPLCLLMNSRLCCHLSMCSTIYRLMHASCSNKRRINETFKATSELDIIRHSYSILSYIIRACVVLLFHLRVKMTKQGVVLLWWPRKHLVVWTAFICYIIKLAIKIEYTIKSLCSLVKRTYDRNADENEVIDYGN